MILARETGLAGTCHYRFEYTVTDNLFATHLPALGGIPSETLVSRHSGWAAGGGAGGGCAAGGGAFTGGGGAGEGSGVAGVGEMGRCAAFRGP